jgi:hypothetical protein
MDPMALFAIAGLIFAGKKLSDKEGYTGMPADREIQGEGDIERRSRQMFHLQSNDMGIQGGTAVNISGPKELMGGGAGYMKKEIMGNFGDISKNSNRLPYGQPVYDLYNRQGVTNKMNNLAPAEKMLVGRGLGVGADVPAQGGFQQFFRVLPTNTNENNLTQLPGRAGPPEATVKSAPPVQGDLTQTQRPPKTFMREPARGKAHGGQGVIEAPEYRPRHVRTERATLKQQMGKRDDSLAFGPMQYQLVTSQDARNVSGNQIRGTGNRSNAIDGVLPGGRMNVRQDPTGLNGAVTQTRQDNNTQPIGPMNGTSSQQYKGAEMYRFNEFKTNPNPHAAKLDLAQNQLRGNPLAFSISSA